MATAINELIRATSTPWTATKDCTVVIYTANFSGSTFIAGNVYGEVGSYFSSTYVNNVNPIALKAGQQVSCTNNIISITGWTV